MENAWTKLMLIVSLILCSSCNNVIVTSTGDLADPDLKEIAMMRADPHWGTVVIYNPITCKEIGDACSFFRLHAYAHNKLNHTLLANPSSYPTSHETQADCWAAKYGEANDVKAAVKLFLDKDRNPAWKIHGNPVERAENIRSCAIEVGKWIDNLK